MTSPAPEPLSLEQLLSQGPVVSQQQQRTPIGVPADYVVERPGEEIRVEGIGYRTGQPTIIPPSFFDGDEYIPAQQSAEDRARLQMLMYRLGILSKDFQLGVWDAPTRLAYRGVLEFANGAGITDVGLALRQYGESIDVSKMRNGEQPKRAPLVIRKTSPDELRRVFEAAASQALGERAPAEEIERMVRAYQGQEAAFQRQAWDATYEGGTLTEPPSAETFAMDQFEETRPIETGAFEVADRVAQDFTSLLDGPFGG